MPFEGFSAMSLKEEFVRLALVEGANVSELCRRFGVSRPTGHKWLSRYRQAGLAGLVERSRRPLQSPLRCSEAMEAAVLSVRRDHPAWGGRKIRHWLLRAGLAAPAASTVTAILARHGEPLGQFGGGSQSFIRFEHEAPNDLWQMDFKGHVALGKTLGARLYPLTILDDHSRFAIDIGACLDQLGTTVQTRLVAAFRRYGLPWRIAVDNGAPWGTTSDNPFTTLSVWLIELGVRVSHSRPYHPQTLGKDERFHRSLKAEAMANPFGSLSHAQTAFDAWRRIYNTERPHEALAYAVPADRYRLSPRAFCEYLPAFEYGPDDRFRKVQANGWVSFKNRPFRFPKAFIGKTIALRPTPRDGEFDAFFRHQKIKSISLHGIANETRDL